VSAQPEQPAYQLERQLVLLVSVQPKTVLDREPTDRAESFARVVCCAHCFALAPEALIAEHTSREHDDPGGEHL
jgi:hypothetical protein